MPAGSDDETALTHAPPAGIAVVRRTAHLDGGPFRDAEVAEDLQLTFPGADDPSGSPFSPAVAVVSVPIIVTALIAGAFELASVLTGISFLALHEWTLRRRPRSSRLVIASSAIISQDQTSVPLGRIRRTSAIPTSKRTRSGSIRPTASSSWPAFAEPTTPATSRPGSRTRTVRSSEARNVDGVG